MNNLPEKDFFSGYWTPGTLLFSFPPFSSIRNDGFEDMVQCRLMPTSPEDDFHWKKKNGNKSVTLSSAWIPEPERNVSLLIFEKEDVNHKTSTN